jgi:hypothetical protein
MAPGGLVGQGLFGNLAPLATTSFHWYNPAVCKSLHNS